MKLLFILLLILPQLAQSKQPGLCSLFGEKKLDSVLHQVFKDYQEDYCQNFFAALEKSDPNKISEFKALVANSLMDSAEENACISNIKNRLVNYQPSSTPVDPNNPFNGSFTPYQQISTYIASKANKNVTKQRKQKNTTADNYSFSVQGINQIPNEELDIILNDFSQYVFQNYRLSGIDFTKATNETERNVSTEHIFHCLHAKAKFSFMCKLLNGASDNYIRSVFKNYLQDLFFIARGNDHLRMLQNGACMIPDRAADQELEKRIKRSLSSE